MSVFFMTYYVLKVYSTYSHLSCTSIHTTYRNSFIAFTGSHQLLLFPMFQIQRKLQKRVFGIRFWEKIERASKENFNDRNKNEFNPRHVQILLRTYQTGGAAAVLSHTGDPNKGLREWYENQKKNDIVDEADLPDEPSKMSRWTSVRNVVNNSKRNILDGQSIKQKTIGRVRELKRSKPSLKKKVRSQRQRTAHRSQILTELDLYM